MTTLVAAPTELDGGAVVRRTNFAFAADGGMAGCIAGTDERAVIEAWRFPRQRAPVRTALPWPAAGPRTLTLPLPDGRMLIVPNTADEPRLAIVGPPPARQAPQWLAQPPTPGMSLLQSSRPGTHAVLITRPRPEYSMLWWVTGDGLAPITRLPGMATSGLWLTPDGRWLAVNRAHVGTAASSVALVDTSSGVWEPFISVRRTSADRVMCCHPGSGLLAVGTDVGGEHRVGWTIIGDRQPVRFPAALLDPSCGPPAALAVDPAGDRLLVCRQRGARSELLVYTPRDDRLERVETPLGCVVPPASWTRDGITVAFTSPSRPTAPIRLRDPADRNGVASRGWPEPERAWADARLVSLSGPAGTIEAIAYGDPWRAERVVLALHGGPLSLWPFRFEPLFQELTAAGVACLAPNYRGSIGYGRRHLAPVLGAWGEADLDDVLHLAAGLVAQRHGMRPAVLGVSYGAFLALLAAAAAPHLWSGCVAVAPFVSGAKLAGESEEWLGRGVRRLGGAGHRSGSAPPDLLDRCAGIRAPLLLAHATGDELIPAGHTLALRERLVAAGRRDGIDLNCYEVPGDHKAIARLEHRGLRNAIVSFCAGRR